MPSAIVFVIPCSIQQLLHRNLVYLATLADSNHSSMQQLLQVIKMQDLNIVCNESSAKSF